MPEITRKIEFDAGHRVLGHESKCAHLHGHRYVAEFTVSAEKLDKVSRVIDFSVVKDIMKNWIDENWDHNILLHMRDPLLEANVPVHSQGKDGAATLMPWHEALDLVQAGSHVQFCSDPIFGGKVPYIVHWELNPTAEVMAAILYEEAKARLPEGIAIVNVRLYETPNCWADHRG